VNFYNDIIGLNMTKKFNERMKATNYVNGIMCNVLVTYVGEHTLVCDGLFGQPSRFSLMFEPGYEASTAPIFFRR
jgi:hypothetical protein